MHFFLYECLFRCAYIYVHTQTHILYICTRVCTASSFIQDICNFAVTLKLVKRQIVVLLRLNIRIYTYILYRRKGS